ncbi:MAG: transposase [Spirochaetota bacterium]|nr:transposase [Spirochaetota bacterium]
MKRKPYTKEFKRQIIELKEQGKTAKEISSEYGIDIYNNG